jgi:hypothetical protein
MMTYNRVEWVIYRNFPCLNGKGVYLPDVRQPEYRDVQIGKTQRGNGWLKVVFGILAAIDVSLLAWLAQSYRSANALLLVVGALAVAGITAAVVWVNHRAYQKIDELEEL